MTNVSVATGDAGTGAKVRSCVREQAFKNSSPMRPTLSLMRKHTVTARRVAAMGIAICGLAIVQETAWSKETAGGPAVVRRLTESQYRASVADIFGADTPVVGRFERELRSDGLIAVGTSEAGMSSFSIEQYDASARGIAAMVISKEHREQLLPCQPDVETSFDKGCAQKVVDRYGPLLFRRPLTSQEKKNFVDTARIGYDRLGNFYRGVEFALAGLMVKPDFLLRIEHIEPDPRRSGEFRLDPYSKAMRLSYFLTNSTPDSELLRAAGAGELDREASRKAQVERLMASPRFETAVRAFFEDMFEFEKFDDVSKDPIIFPVFNSDVAADAQEQTLRTVTNHLLTKQGDYRDLFTTQSTFLTRALGRVYKVPVATRNDWEAKEFAANSGQSGILTNVSFLALHSHPGRSSPTLRGKAIREVFMCQKVPDPPPDVDFSAVDQVVNNKVSPTARDRLEEHQTEPSCTSCHKSIDPLGLTLENFDGVGSFRAIENGATIDASGTLDGVEFSGAQGLGKALHDNPATTHCLVDKMYRSALGRALVPQERATLEELNRVFAANGYRVPDLMRAIALSDAFFAVAGPSNESAQGQQPARISQQLESR